MTKVGVIGLGDMGSGLAKNLCKNGFKTYGYDLSEDRMSQFIKMGVGYLDAPLGRTPEFARAGKLNIMVQAIGRVLVR